MTIGSGLEVDLQASAYIRPASIFQKHQLHNDVVATMLYVWKVADRLMRETKGKITCYYLIPKKAHTVESINLPEVTAIPYISCQQHLFHLQLPHHFFSSSSLTHHTSIAGIPYSHQNWVTHLLSQPQKNHLTIILLLPSKHLTKEEGRD